MTAPMSGMSTLVVYVVERGKDLVGDAVTFPVDALVKNNFRVSIEEHSSKTQIKVSVEGVPGSRVSLTGIILGTPQMQTHNHLSKTEVSFFPINLVHFI